jgi:hypothetical protein
MTFQLRKSTIECVKAAHRLRVRELLLIDKQNLDFSELVYKANPSSDSIYPFRSQNADVE